MVSVGAYREQVAARMGEKQLDRHVRALLKDLGLAPFAFHPPDGITAACECGRKPAGRVNGRYRAGFPDWCIAGEGGVLFRELKRQDGTLTAVQQAFHRRLREAGADVDVWRPSDLTDGRIARELAAIARPGTAT